MAKNEQSREANQPIWFDGKSINEALFCDDFLGRHKIIYLSLIHISEPTRPY